jgi:ferredoxin
MALKIIDECICCDACVPVCPTSAIECDDPIYTIDSTLCTECVGYFKEPECIKVCPVDAIVVDEKLGETKQMLTKKFKSSRQK